MKNKYLCRRIVVLKLKLDFDLFAERKDQKQFDLFMNIMMSEFYKVGKGNTLRVYDFLGEMKSKK